MERTLQILDKKKGNLLLIKYEDLISDPLNELEKISFFKKLC